jgi:GT2 family glycosyltransferase
MISVLVVSHDSAATLERCLASLGPLDGDGLEAIVVDTASGDGSPELVETGFPAARLVRLSTNVGFAAAANRAAAHAGGDSLLLLNPDAWLLDDALDRLATRLAGDRHLAVVAPRLQYPDGRTQVGWAPDRGVLGEAAQKLLNRLEGRPVAGRFAETVARAVLDPGWYTGACLLVRRRAFEAVGGFDEGFVLYFEDADLGLRLRRAGWRAVREPSARVAHVRGGSTPPEGTELIYRRSQLAYYRRHRPTWEVRLLLAHLRRRYPAGPVAEWLMTIGKNTEEDR